MERRIRDRSDEKFVRNFFLSRNCWCVRMKTFCRKHFDRFQTGTSLSPWQLACSLPWFPYSLVTHLGFLLEGTKLLAPSPCSPAGSWLTGLLQLEIHNVLCEGNQKKKGRMFFTDVLVGLPASRLSISSGKHWARWPRKPPAVEAGCLFSPRMGFLRVRWSSLTAHCPRVILSFLLKPVD